MDNNTHEIVSVYHEHVDCDSEVDEWSRKYLHGLNRNYLRTHGFEEVHELVLHFQRWIKSFDVVCMYANAPDKERQLLPGRTIHDLLLPPWQERMRKPYHVVANRYKELRIPIVNVRCGGYIHSQYEGIRCHVQNKTQMMKLLHGFHCSLYDCYELYLYYLLQTQYL